jgi:cell division septation protein DedD
MKQLLTLSLLIMMALASCKYFSNAPDARLAKLDSALQKEKAAHAKDIDQLKQESQSRIDSLKVSCEKQLNRYHVIVGAFKVAANAENLQKLMSSKGYTAQVLSLGSYQLVSVGSFASLRESTGQLNKFRSEVNKDAWIYVR